MTGGMEEARETYTVTTGDEILKKKPDLECCYWKSGNYCLKLKSRVGYQDCSKDCEHWRKR